MTWNVHSIHLCIKIVMISMRINKNSKVIVCSPKKWGVYFCNRITTRTTQQTTVGIKYYYVAFLSYTDHTQDFHIYQFVYQNFFNFSHFCDFHIPFVYQNCHILTIHRYFSLILSSIPNWEKTFYFFFSCRQTFSWRFWSCLLDISRYTVKCSLIRNTCVWK